MIDVRTPIINTINRHSRALEMIYEKAMAEVLESLGDDDPCVPNKSCQECRQIGDLVIYHMHMDLFQTWFNWHHRPVNNTEDAILALKEEECIELG